MAHNFAKNQNNKTPAQCSMPILHHRNSVKPDIPNTNNSMKMPLKQHQQKL